MKKIIVTIFAIVWFALAQVSASVADPAPFKYRQPDGSVVTLQLHGDEFRHWTTCNGRKVSLCSDGFYRPVSDAPAPKTTSVPMLDRAQAYKAASTNTSISMGQNHFLVLLIEFDDLHFSVSSPQLAFNALLNRDGYNAYGATGSVHDYFRDNSSGKFDPIFDVVGPIRVGKSYKYYGENVDGSDAHADELLYDACVIADKDIDFSIYDHDGDGYVDNVFFYYAGHNEAERGGEDTIWPHAWMLVRHIGRFDGVRVLSYACTSEFRGESGSTMSGIGTFCHEFAHVLGLPDFYDTDYEENGSAATLGDYSLMCDGSYNNSGRTPPCLNCEERMLLGWMDNIPSIGGTGIKTLSGVENNSGLKAECATNGEYFLFESRGGSTWDKYVKPGLIIYHVDKSSGHMVGDESAAGRWSSRQGINCYADHPCFYIVSEALPYEGCSRFDNVSDPGNEDWDGEVSGHCLSDITYSRGTVTFSYKFDTTVLLLLTGTVRTTSGKPIPGAKVCLTLPGPMTGGGSPRLRTMEQTQSGSGLSATTGADGQYSIDVTSVIGHSCMASVTAKGFLGMDKSFELKKSRLEQDFVLNDIIEGTTPVDLQKFKGSPAQSIGTGTAGETVSGGARFYRSEISGHVGKTIKSICFAVQDGKGQKVTVGVISGEETIFAQTVTEVSPSGALTTVDISSEGIKVPADKDITLFVTVEKSASGHPLLTDGEVTARGGFLYRSGDSGQWYEDSTFGNLIIGCTVGSEKGLLYHLGVCCIASPRSSGIYPAGSEFPLVLTESNRSVASVKWSLDGAAVSGESVRLTAGEHLICAEVTFESGETEVLEQKLRAE